MGQISNLPFGPALRPVNTRGCEVLGMHVCVCVCYFSSVHGFIFMDVSVHGHVNVCTQPICSESLHLQ